VTKTKTKEVRDFLWSMAHKKSFVSRLSNCIKDAVRWMNCPQPLGALASPSGICCKDTFAGFSIRCTPKGFGDTPVIVFMKLKGPPISPAESYCLVNMVREHAEVAETWGGQDGSKKWPCCFAVRLSDPAGLDMLRSLNGYFTGCTDHPETAMLCNCGWYEKGKKKLIVPSKFKKI
jgi:hypothetical protein